MPPREKVINRSVVTKLLDNGRASEDTDQWTEEVKLHCERCYDDKAEPLRCRLKGFGDRGLAGTDALPSRCQRTCRLSGDRNAAGFADGDSVRGGASVRQAV